MPLNSLEGVCILILFPLLATGVVDTGGKFAASIVDTGGKFAQLVAKFAAGVVDTGGKFAAGVIVTPEAILPPVLIWNGPNGILWVWGGKLIHEKNQKQKISCLFKCGLPSLVFRMYEMSNDFKRNMKKASAIDILKF